MSNVAFSGVLALLIMLAGCNESTDIKETNYGIDISHYQGDLISTLNSSSKLRFIISKATQGITYQDPMFQKNWQEIKQRGFVRGAYHFYMADDDASKQVENFYNTVGYLDKSDMTPIVDIEGASLSGDSANIEIMQRDFLSFLNTFELKLERKPMIYTNYTFAQKYLLDPKFAEYDLWLAEYSGAEQPKVPDTWKTKGYKIWQKSESHILSHTKDLVETDFDEYIGLMQDLVK